MRGNMLFRIVSCLLITASLLIIHAGNKIFAAVYVYTPGIDNLASNLGNWRVNGVVPVALPIPSDTLDIFAPTQDVIFDISLTVQRIQITSTANAGTKKVQFNAGTSFFTQECQITYSAFATPRKISVLGRFTCVTPITITGQRFEIDFSAAKLFAGGVISTSAGSVFGKFTFPTDTDVFFAII